MFRVTSDLTDLWAVAYQGFRHLPQEIRPMNETFYDTCHNALSSLVLRMAFFINAIRVYLSGSVLLSI